MVSPTRSLVAGRLEMFFSPMRSTTADGRRAKVWRGRKVEGVSLSTVGLNFFCFFKVSGVEEGHACTKAQAVSRTRSLETGRLVSVQIIMQSISSSLRKAELNRKDAAQILAIHETKVSG